MEVWLILASIVIVTTLVVAATANAISRRFDSFSRIGGIIGTSVSASFLIILGLMNIYILYKLVREMKRLLASPHTEGLQLRFEGAGCLFVLLRKMFKIVDRYYIFPGSIPL